MDAILFAETLDDVGLVFMNAANKIIRDANVQRPADLTCQDLDAIAAAHADGCVYWIARRSLSSGRALRGPVGGR
jgi:hypothetical protein